MIGIHLLDYLSRYHNLIVNNCFLNASSALDNPFIIQINKNEFLDLPMYDIVNLYGVIGDITGNVSCNNEINSFLFLFLFNML